MSVGVGILGFAHGHVHAYCSRWRDQAEEVPFTMAWQIRMAPHNLQLIELQQRRGTLPGADHFPPPSLWEGSGGGIRGPSPFPLPAGEGMRLSCISFPRVNSIPWPPGGIQLKWYLHQAGKWTISGLPEIRDHGERIAGLAGPLAEFLRRERPATATAQDGRNALGLVLACYASAEQGRRIYLW